ncbi:MAG: DegT/DnrJ/EryC1/StrS family aminotransferase [Syntrophomonas sp.]|nr:DegT/DnrJ/EryC1/StrS family aminotransferase [Syntrophomonas sp.]
MGMNYPLASSTWDNAELLAIQNVVNSGLFTMGKYVYEFEQAFARFIGSRYCLMVNSGSSANLLAVAALFYRKDNFLKPGDEVIVPAVSWSTTYFPLYQYGLKLKIVDIDSATLNYNSEALAEAITDQTRLIVAVNLLGNPNRFNEINRLIGKRNIILLEDNCEAMGAVYEEKYTGTFGIMGSFSTFFSHHITTMEGGLIVSDDEELYHILLSLRAHGWTRNLPEQNLVCGMKSSNYFTEAFRFVLPGYNLRPLEISAAVGLEQLKKLPEFIRIRRENAAFFQELFRDNPYFMIQEEIEQSSWMGFALIIRPDVPLDRGSIVKELQENGIECRPIVAGNFVKNEVIRWFDYEVHGILKNAELIDENGFYVGNHSIDLQEQLIVLHSVLT